MGEGTLLSCADCNTRQYPEPQNDWASSTTGSLGLQPIRICLVNYRSDGSSATITYQVRNERKKPKHNRNSSKPPPLHVKRRYRRPQPRVQSHYYHKPNGPAEPKRSGA